MALTAYVVLESQTRSPQTWAVTGIQDASTSEAAVRKMAKALDRDGEFVAVPARSFQPIRVFTETFSRTVSTASGT